MARICINRKWYEQVEPSTFSEDQFEDRVTLHAPSVYPFYHVFPFKKFLQAPDDSKEDGYSLVTPDLAFIAEDYTEWWVVEVEMGYHDFRSHVRPQVDKLLRAIYSDDEIDYLCSKDTSLDRAQLARLVKNTDVRVLVIINQSMPKWTCIWPKDKVVFAVFELFCSEDNEEIFRVNGAYPSILMDKISDCSIHPAIPRLLHVKEPDKLGLARRATVKLLYNNCLTEWRRIDEHDQVFLTSVNRYPLKPNRRYSIYRQNDGQLVLLQDAGPRVEDIG
jgi:hypothetical protein